MKGSHLKEKRKDTRARLWNFILYPESLPVCWKTILDDLHIPIGLSPLHSRDVYIEDGEDHKKGDLKKPHYHGVMCFGGKKSFSQVCEILDKLNAPIPQPCNSLIASIRYFCHLDNPDKAQYPKEEILSFGGMNIDKAFVLQKEDYTRAMKEIYLMVKDNESVKTFEDLASVVMSTNPDYVLVLGRYTYFFRSILESRKNRYKI